MDSGLQDSQDACNPSGFRIDVRGQDRDIAKVKQRRQTRKTQHYFAMAALHVYDILASAEAEATAVGAAATQRLWRAVAIHHRGVSLPSRQKQLTMTFFSLPLLPLACSNRYVRLSVCPTVRSPSFFSSNHEPAPFTRTERKMVQWYIVYRLTDMNIHVTLGHATRITNNARSRCLFKGLDPSATSYVLIKASPLSMNMLKIPWEVWVSIMPLSSVCHLIS